MDCFCTPNLCEPREAVAVHQSRSLPPSPFQSAWPVLWAGWAAQDCGRHGFLLGLVSANFASWTTWAVLQHRFPSRTSHPSTGNTYQPAVKAMGFLPPCKINTRRHGTRPRVTACPAPASPTSRCEDTNCCLCLPWGRAAGTQNEFCLLFNLIVSWCYSGNYTGVSLCKLFLLSLVFSLTKNRGKHQFSKSTLA